MSTTEPTLLTLQEAADAVGCHYQTLYKRVRSGELPALVAGGSYRINRADLDAWLHERDAAKGAVPERAERDWPRQIETLLASLITGDARAARKQLDRLTSGGVTVDELCDHLLASSGTTTTCRSLTSTAPLASSRHCSTAPRPRAPSRARGSAAPLSPPPSATAIRSRRRWWRLDSRHRALPCTTLVPICRLKKSSTWPSASTRTWWRCRAASRSGAA